MQMICCDCGTLAKPKTDMRGSLLMEMFLWLMMFFPGLLYSLWRLTTKRKVCRSCGSPTLVKPASPRGRMVAQQFAGRA
jgi:hypothetical protein